MAKASKNKSQKIKRKDNSEDRLRYILAYLRTGKELDINTVDEEGRPIGLWAIDLRCRINGGKQIDENLRKELDEFSFFERKYLSLDAHIERAIEWIKKYPKARFSTNFNKKILREYASSDEEFELLCADYDKANLSYTYLRARNAKGKLSPDEYERLCKACVGNAFGYLDLSKKYGIQLRTVEYIMKKFGTMEAFYDAYKSGNVTYKFDINLARKAFIDIIDIDGRNDKGYDDLFRSCLKRNKLPRCGVYSSVGLEMATDEILKTWKKNSDDRKSKKLTNSQKTIGMRYGFIDGKTYSFREIGDALGFSCQRATEIVYNLFLDLLRPEMRSKFDFNIDESLLRHEALMPQKKKRLENIAKMIKDIGLRNVDRNSPEVIKELEFLRETKSLIVEMGENSKNTGKKGCNNRVLAPKPKKEPERESSNDSKSSIDENTNAKRDARQAFIEILYKIIDKKKGELDVLRTSGRNDGQKGRNLEEVDEE